MKKMQTISIEKFNENINVACQIKTINKKTKIFTHTAKNGKKYICVKLCSVLRDASLNKNK